MSYPALLSGLGAGFFLVPYKRSKVSISYAICFSGQNGSANDNLSPAWCWSWPFRIMGFYVAIARISVRLLTTITERHETHAKLSESPLESGRPECNEVWPPLPGCLWSVLVCTCQACHKPIPLSFQTHHPSLLSPAGYPSWYSSWYFPCPSGALVLFQAHRAPLRRTLFRAAKRRLASSTDTAARGTPMVAWTCPLNHASYATAVLSH